MFRKLRIKFIAIIMASVAIVLAIVFAGICMAEYQRSLSATQSDLNMAVDRAVMFAERANGTGDFGETGGGGPHGGRFNDGGPFPSGGPEGGDPGVPDGDAMNENALGDGSMEGDDTSFAEQPFRIGGREEDRMRSNIPLAVYTSGEDGTLTAVADVTTAYIDPDVLEEVSDQVVSMAEGHGTLNGLSLHYYKRTIDGIAYIAFADTSTTADWESLALTLVIAGLGTLAVFFIISLFLSKWALRPVREAWDSQRQFIADASHDLKTPLTVILANASILLKHPESSIASQSQWIESTQTEAESMQGLVCEMLELAQVEERAQIAHETFDFSDMLDGETLQFESLAFEQGCSFECEIEEGISVNGDAGRLGKMVSTLIENALKYVDAGGTVSVKLVRSGRSLSLTVHNTGAPIAADDLPHIFDRFYRSNKARTSGTGGFGLGLAIARETARAHDGDIACTSTEADGTAFKVTLPIA